MLIIKVSFNWSNVKLFLVFLKVHLSFFQTALVSVLQNKVGNLAKIIIIIFKNVFAKGECSNESDVGIFYDGNDLFFKNEVSLKVEIF